MTTITAEVLKAEGKRARDGRTITPAVRRAELVRGYRSSGLTMAQFAQREGLKTTTLAKWVYLSDQRSGRAPARFAEVKLPPAPRWAFELTLANGWVVRAADATALAALLNVAGRC
jgi:transposase-like protein